jgi:hypothetical protein
LGNLLLSAAKIREWKFSVAKSASINQNEVWNRKGRQMEKNLIDLVAKILEGVTYIVFGGLILATFFCIFAPWVLGITKLQHNLETLCKNCEDTNRLLASIDDHLKKLNQPKEPDKT